MQARLRNKGLKVALVRAVGLALVLGMGCSADGSKSRYILAEKLWNDAKYAAAVTEFEKVSQNDPRGKLGLQALYRAAMTQTLYLSQHAEAIRKFRAYADANYAEPGSAWEAQKHIGEIFFSKTDQYEQAIMHYRALLKLKPQADEAPEFLYRIAKSHFFLWQFDDAIAAYEELQKKYSATPLGEKAGYEIGVTYFTEGEQQPNGVGRAQNTYADAIKAFKNFIALYPKSRLVVEAKFGIANCLEEMDQLDAAYNEYSALKDSYPSPNVIQIKLIRIRERKMQRNR